MQVAAFSETRLAEEGFLAEESAGYKLFWIGRGHNERRQVDVGFFIKFNLLNMLAARQR